MEDAENMCITVPYVIVKRNGGARCCARMGMARGVAGGKGPIRGLGFNEIRKEAQLDKQPRGING